MAAVPPPPSQSTSRSASGSRSPPPPSPKDKRCTHSCRCRNVRLYNVDLGEGEGKRWVDREDVFVRYPELCQGLEILKEPTSSDSAEGEDSHEPSERTLSCLVCDVGVMRARFEKRDGRNGVLGTILVEEIPLGNQQPSDSSLVSPIYELSLPPPSKPSTFAQPPTSTDTPQPPIPPLLHTSPDPFFLPPPFTSSDPYFTTLAQEATDVLHVFREEREREMKKFVEKQREIVRAYEARLRNEVEVIWTAFQRGPQGRKHDEGTGGARSTSLGRVTVTAERSTSFEKTAAIASPSPGITVTSPTPFGTLLGGATSLLSASLAGHSFFPPSFSRSGTDNTPVSPPAKIVQGPIDDGTLPTSPSAARTFENPVTQPYHRPKSGIDLDVASSMRVSHMDDLMGSAGRSATRREERERREMSAGDAKRVEGVDRDLDPIDRFEENVLRVGSATADEERTPRTRTVKQLNAGSQEKSPLKESVGRRLSGGESTQERPSRHVKFEEPKEERERSLGLGLVQEEEEDDDVVVVGHEDAVFEFEDHDVPLDDQIRTVLSSDPTAEEPLSSSTLLPPDAAIASSAASPSQLADLQKDKESIETKLSDLVAADAPSHRAAWKNNKQKIWQVMGRSKSRRTGGGDDADEENLFVYASSMPIAIVIPGERTECPLGLELKTSLRDRPTIFVPPLKPAVRQGRASNSGKTSPIPEGNEVAIPSDSPLTRKRSRSASISRSPSTTRRPDPSAAIANASTGGYSLREQRIPSGGADPGPALEGMSDDEGDEDDVVGGKSFVPPHVRAEESGGIMGDAGWRSMAS